jgi:hypothetical protein
VKEIPAGEIPVWEGFGQSIKEEGPDQPLGAADWLLMVWLRFLWLGVAVAATRVQRKQAAVWTALAKPVFAKLAEVKPLLREMKRLHADRSVAALIWNPVYQWTFDSRLLFSLPLDRGRTYEKLLSLLTWFASFESMRRKLMLRTGT